MAVMMIGIVLLHVASLTCLLLLARHSVMLVDEHGRPLGRAEGWTERVVPCLSGVPRTKNEPT